MNPGKSAFTRTPAGRGSAAAVSVRLRTAALDAAYEAISGEPAVAVIEDRVMMEPPPEAMIAGAA